MNPDPRELWKCIPSDPGLEYWRPDAKFETRQCGNASITGASLRGRSHAHAGLPRDDDFAFACCNGWQIMAVADGAGSAPFSRRGAELACQVALTACAEKLVAAPELDEIFGSLQTDGSDRRRQLGLARRMAYGVLPYAAFAVYKAIRNEAAGLGRDISAYATTLLLALAKKYARGWCVLAFQTGDGAIAALSPGSSRMLCIPDEGEYGGQTCFVTMSGIYDGHELMRRLYVGFYPDLQGLLLLTDGISDPLFGSRAALEDMSRWRELWHALRPLSVAENAEKRFMDWLAFWARGSHDDRTVAMLAVEG